MTLLPGARAPRQSGALRGLLQVGFCQRIACFFIAFFQYFGQMEVNIFAQCRHHW